MKTTTTFLAVILSVIMGCNHKQEEEITATFDASVQGVGGDCKLPLLDFGAQTAAVEKLVGSTNTKLYYAVNLNPAFSQAGTSLQVTIRKVTTNEERACTTMGPSYPSIAIVTAVSK